MKYTLLFRYNEDDNYQINSDDDYETVVDAFCKVISAGAHQAAININDQGKTIAAFNAPDVKTPILTVYS